MDSMVSMTSCLSRAGLNRYFDLYIDALRFLGMDMDRDGNVHPQNGYVVFVLELGEFKVKMFSDVAF